MRWERSTTGWQRNTTRWQRGTTGWNCDTMRWQRNSTHLQCIDNELQCVFKTQCFCVDFSYAGFSQIGSQLCMISNAVMNELYQTWNRLFTDLNQDWLSPNHLEEFAVAVRNRGAVLDNCWGFVDGTVRPICQAGQNQKCLYNGHKEVHAIKFLSIAAPSGLVANLYGPVEGRRHDSG